jgi:hypothetical protein
MPFATTAADRRTSAGRGVAKRMAETTAVIVMLRRGKRLLMRV